MTRRIVRSGYQLASIALVLVFFVFLLDNRYRVLPEKLHEWNPAHHNGLVVTDITVTTCSSISLLSKCDLGGEWHRIQKDLYLDKSWFSHGYVHVQRKREEELLDTDKVVFDVRVSRLDPTTSEKDQGDKKWEQRPGGVWLLRSSKPHASDSQKAVTAVDVLFGADAVEPRPGWEIRDQAIQFNTGDAPEPRLSVRRGVPKTPAKPQLRIRKDGKFKIVQVSDMHLSTGLGLCRDEYPPSKHCDADTRTLGFVGEVLDNEKPDLVVLSGDQVNGETAPDAQSAMFKFAELLVKRQIPYTLIFGNHDDEGSLSRSALMALTESLPFSLAEAGPVTVEGVGNYVVEVLARGGSGHSAITLYFLDSHSYSPDEAHYVGYDWLKPSQLQWFREEAQTRRNSPSHKDYTHHHLDMGFLHIPLPEYRDPEKLIKNSGAWREGPTAPRFNTGFKDVLIENNIFAVSCGHDHVNDYCNLDQHSNPEGLQTENVSEDVKQFATTGRLWMCYAGGSGYGGYAGYGGYERRVRVWEFDMDGARVETWKRVDGKDNSGREARVDVKLVVEAGKVVLG